MRLPHITIEYREEESFAPGKMSWPLIVGFGFHWAWIYLVMLNSNLLFPAVTPDVKAFVFGLSLAVFAATLLCYGVFLESMRRLFGSARARRRNRLLGAVFMSIATALVVAAGLPGPLGLVFACVSGVLSGAGSAVLLMSYGVSFSVCDVATVTLSTAFAFFLGSVFFACILLLDFIAHPLGAILCVAIPFVELACLNRSSTQLVDNLQFGFATMSVHTAPFALHVFVPGLVIGFFLGIVRMLAVTGAGGEQAGDFALAVGIAGVVAGLLIVVSLFTQRQSNNFLFRTLFPVVALLIASLAVIKEPGYLYVTFVLFASYILLEATMWVFYADISQRFRLSAFTVFGFGRGSLALGSLASFALMQPGSLVDASPQDSGVLVAVAFVALMFGMSLLPKNAELRRTLKHGAHCPALQEDDERYSRVGDAPGSGASDDDAAGNDALDGKEPVEGEEAAQNAEAASGLEAKAPDSARMQVLDEVEEHLANHEESKQQRIGRFKRKCAVVAETYLLSRKETEVLFLLAKGRNSAAIQEQLYISAGTANTHMRHIYRKLDVHSQQELIALVESVEVSDDWN